MAPTAVRSFVVFKDDTPSSPSQHKPTDDVPTPVTVVPVTGPLLVFCPDKENINPLTGLRASAEQQSSKKRKTGVLATKLHVPPPTKKHKDSKDSKKRGSSAPVSGSSKARPVADKAKRSGSLKRSATKGPSRARRSPSLPRVAEDAEIETLKDQQLRLSQAEVDARCYELTVSPLADVSKAYEQAPSPETDHATFEESKEKEEKVQEQLANVTEIPRTSSPTSDDLASTSSKADAAPFSTPERKHIYTSFTFLSPSPSSVRLATLRVSTADRFADLEF